MRLPRTGSGNKNNPALPQLFSRSIIVKPMAPKSGSRVHPYRSTSAIETPTALQSCSWYAGPCNVPAGAGPPPNRPILVLVDFQALQDLSHVSSNQYLRYAALRPSNFRLLSAGEYESLFTWSQQYSPEMASARDVGGLRVAITQRLMHQWDVRVEPVDLELRHADLSGDVFQVPNTMTIMRLIEEYRPEWRVRQYSYLSSTPLVPGTPQPFIVRLTCHKVRQGVILP